jgi:hypothetical protein
MTSREDVALIRSRLALARMHAEASTQGEDND